MNFLPWVLSAMLCIVNQCCRDAVWLVVDKALTDVGRTMPTPLRLRMPSHLYARYVKELWSQITSAQGLRLQSMLVRATQI